MRNYEQQLFTTLPSEERARITAFKEQFSIFLAKQDFAIHQFLLSPEATVTNLKFALWKTKEEVEQLGESFTNHLKENYRLKNIKKIPLPALPNIFKNYAQASNKAWGEETSLSLLTRS